MATPPARLAPGDTGALYLGPACSVDEPSVQVVHVSGGRKNAFFGGCARGCVHPYKIACKSEGGMGCTRVVQKSRVHRSARSMLSDFWADLEGVPTTSGGPKKHFFSRRKHSGKHFPMASSHVINMSIFASFPLSEEEAQCVLIQGYILINDIKLRCFVLDPSAVLFLLRKPLLICMGNPTYRPCVWVFPYLDC